MLITFTDYYKKYTQLYGKNWSADYLLFVNKIIREKVGTNFIIPNERQKFVVNYEIKKLINKAINTRSNKYNNIVYVYSNIKSNAINSLMNYLIHNYPQLDFSVLLIGLDDIIINEDIYNKLQFVEYQTIEKDSSEEDE